MHGLWSLQTGRGEGMKWLAKRQFNFIDTVGIGVVNHSLIQGEALAAVVAFVAFFGLSVWVENQVTKK